MKLFLILSLLFSYYCKAQIISDNASFGLNVGVFFQVGTHNNAAGIKLQGYFLNDFIQINAGNSLQFHLSGYGKRKTFVENRANLGLVIGFGNSSTPKRFILDGLNHQTGKNLAVGYNYILYSDNRGTDQLSGGFCFHNKAFSILVENDLFAGQGKDRFRTGGVQVNYQYTDFNFKLNTTLWTSERSKIKQANQTQNSKQNQERHTHGIVKIGVDYHLNFGQIAHLDIGFDSEKWRYKLQNEIIHGNLKNTTKTYPYASEDGISVYDKILARKTKPYLLIGLNNEIFY